MEPIDYSKFLKVIGQNDRQGLFIITKAILVDSFGVEDSSVRCDSGGYGPQGLLWQEDSEFPFGPSWIPSISHLQTYEIVLDYSPYFYIIYVELLLLLHLLILIVNMKQQKTKVDYGLLGQCRNFLKTCLSGLLCTMSLLTTGK